MADLARFERATSTFAELRSHSAELQVPTLSIANCQLPICYRPKHRLHTDQSEIDNWQSAMSWRKARESNPTRTKPPQFSRLFDTLCCRAFRKVWQGRPDLNRESRFWRPMVCQLAYIPKSFLVHVVGLAPTKSLRTPDFEGGCFCYSATHAK